MLTDWFVRGDGHATDMYLCKPNHEQIRMFRAESFTIKQLFRQTDDGFENNFATSWTWNRTNDRV